MRRPWALLACSAVALALVACSTSTSTPTAAPTGCHGARSTGHLVLSDANPIPVVRAVPGTCIKVSVPPSGFPGKSTEPPRVTPDGRLELVSDTLGANGGRTVYYSAVRSGTATVSTTVGVQTNQEIPEWSGLVVVGRRPLSG